MYQCDASVVGQCNDNPVKFVEPLKCTRFHTDNTGPWFMIANAMRGSKCGEAAVSFFFCSNFGRVFNICYCVLG